MFLHGARCCMLVYLESIWIVISFGFGFGCRRRTCKTFTCCSLKDFYRYNILLVQALLQKCTYFASWPLDKSGKSQKNTSMKHFAHLITSLKVIDNVFATKYVFPNDDVLYIYIHALNYNVRHLFYVVSPSLQTMGQCIICWIALDWNQPSRTAQWRKVATSVLLSSWKQCVSL